MMQQLSKHADRFLGSTATVTTSDHLALIDRDVCSKRSVLASARYRWIVYDVSESCFGEWDSYRSENEAEFVVARGIGAFSNGGYKGK